MTEPLQYQSFLLLGRVCEIHAVADSKRPGRKSKAQLALEEAETVVAESPAIDEEAAKPDDLQVSAPGKPVTDGHGFIKQKLLEHLDVIAVGMFKDAKAMKPATLKLLWDMGKMNEKAEPTGRGDEMTLSRLLLNELRQKSKPVNEAQEQA